MADSSTEKHLETLDEVDRISALPDHILCQILSFLPLKEAAATSVVATRWQHLFASLPDINLEFSQAPETELEEMDYLDENNMMAMSKAIDSRIFDFINFGNRIFHLRNGVPLRKFELRFNENLPEGFELAIDKWISAAVSCNVQEITIWYGHKLTDHTIRSTIFKCRTLVSLKLYFNHVALNGICLPLLKVLHLELALVDEDSLRWLIQGCPLLEELDLDISCSVDVSDQLSKSGIFRCKTLVALKLLLHYTPFALLPDSVYLPNLKALYLKRFAYVGRDALQRRLLESCPLLEELVLRGFDFGNHMGHEVVGIYSSSLKYLRLEGCYAEDRYIFVIDSTSLESLVFKVYGESNEIFFKVPNLRYFDYSGDAQRVNFTQGLESPFYSASISVESEFKERTESSSSRVQQAFELINDVQGAKSLWLSDLTLEALYHCQHSLPTFNNLTSLKLEIKEESGGSSVDPIRWWKMLPRLLASAPNLEVLVFDWVFWNNFERDEEFELLLPLALPVCFIEQLREIGIKFFSDFENEFTVVEYILQNAKALKKMTLGALGLHSGLLPEATKRILSFRKCSHDCQIVFECRKDLYTSEFSDDRLESEGVKTYW